MEKITTNRIHKMIALGETELAMHKKGSKTWLLIYKQIEYLEELLK